jgi:hypothetical protein
VTSRPSVPPGPTRPFTSALVIALSCQPWEACSLRSFSSFPAGHLAADPALADLDDPVFVALRHGLPPLGRVVGLSLDRLGHPRLRDWKPPVHGGYTQGWRMGDCNGHQRSPRGPMTRRSGRQHSDHQGILQEAGQSSSLPTQLPRALPGSCPREVAQRGRASPSGRSGSHRRQVEHCRSCRPGHPRAISSGHQRYPAVSHGHSEEAGGLDARL